MRPFLEKETLRTNLQEALQNEDQIESLYERFKLLFLELGPEFKHVNPFELSMIETDELLYNVFYEEDETRSEMSIEVLNINLECYVWQEGKDWCLNDDIYGAKNISDKIVEGFIFNNYPENVFDLYRLLNDGYWIFAPKGLPVFHDDAPADSEEVISWDKDNVLEGTDLSNMSIMTRKKWKELTDRDNKWKK
jgi:hypothetical protein